MFKNSKNFNMCMVNTCNSQVLACIQILRAFVLPELLGTSWQSEVDLENYISNKFLSCQTQVCVPGAHCV